MALNAKKEMFDHIELFGKPALFTNFRIDRSTVPENWYCYDFRGSDSDLALMRPTSFQSTPLMRGATGNFSDNIT